MAKPMDKMTSEELEAYIKAQKELTKKARRMHKNAVAREKREKEAEARKAEQARIEQERQALYEWAKNERLGGAETILELFRSTRAKQDA